VLLSGGLVSLLVGLTEAERWGWGSPAIVGLFALAGALFCAWTLVERRVVQPMVDIRMMVRRPVLFTNVVALLSGLALYMTWVLLPTFFQLPNGLPPSLAPLAD
jgi:hypothetical protein